MKKQTEISISPKTIWTLVAIITSVMLLWVLRDTVVLILVSVVIASFVEKSVSWLRWLKIPRGFKLLLVYSTVGLVVAGIFYLFIPVFLSELSSFLTILPDSIFGQQVNGLLENREIISDITNSQSPVETVTLLSQVYQNYSGVVISSASGILGGVTSAVLVLIISLYLSAQEKGVEKFLKIVTPIHFEKKVISLWVRTREKIESWFQGQLVLALITGVLSFIGLQLIGIPYALLLSLVAGLLALVPFGSFLATVPAVIIALISGNGAQVLFVVLLYVVIQQFENYIFQPLIIKKVTGVPPLVVILALIMGVQLLGFWGLILAIPLAVFVLEILSDFEKRKAKKIKIVSKK